MLELCPAWPWLLGAMVSLWSRYGLAMVWLGRASLKPCSDKLCFGWFRGALVHVEAFSSDQLMKREGWLCWSSVRPGPGFLELCSGRAELLGAMFWLGRAWQALFWAVSGGHCACGGAFVQPINEERRMAVSGLCPASSGYAFGWPGLLGAMFWLGRASLKPCSDKLCFGRFRGALVHVEALSSDQLMKREGWPGPGFLELWSRYGLAMVWLGRASWSYVLAGPGLLETMLWQTLFWEVSGGHCACGGAFVQPINEERRMAVSGLCPASSGLCFWLARASWSYVLAGPGLASSVLGGFGWPLCMWRRFRPTN